MGIDNNAIVFVGLEIENVDVSELEKTIPDYFNEGLSEWLYYNEDKNNGLKIKQTNGYYDGETLIGFEVMDSGSYGCVSDDAHDFMKRVNDCENKFFGMFGVNPKLFLFNYQH